MPACTAWQTGPKQTVTFLPPLLYQAGCLLLSQCCAERILIAQKLQYYTQDRSCSCRCAAHVRWYSACWHYMECVCLRMCADECFLLTALSQVLWHPQWACMPACCVAAACSHRGWLSSAIAGVGDNSLAPMHTYLCRLQSWQTLLCWGDGWEGPCVSQELPRVCVRDNRL